MNTQFPSSLTERISRCGVVAVLVIDEVADALPLARALLEGGIDAMELTLRTPAALGALEAIKQRVPEMLCGIGTILQPEQVRQVREAGAAFGVAPGLNPRVLDEAQRVGLPFAPGILTPSELELALERGCRHLKFFPAEPSGGLKYLKSLAAPYAHLGIGFIPLGGLNEQNVGDYLAHPLVVAVGGSWVAPRDLIQQQDWDTIRQRAADARRIADQHKGMPR